MKRILGLLMLLFSLQAFAGAANVIEEDDIDVTIKENREGVLDETGNITWERSQEYRLSLKLKNPLCHQCRIAPLCGGGCSRYILDKEAVGQFSYCVFNHNDSEIDEFIVNHVEKLIRNQNK